MATAPHGLSALPQGMKNASTASSSAQRTSVSGEPDRAALQRALDISADAVMICSCTTDPPCIVYANAAFERLTGYSSADLHGQAYDRYLLASWQSSSEFVREAIRTGRPATTTLRLVHREGTELYIELRAAPTGDGCGESSHYVIALRDLSETHHQVEHLRFIANHDSLTGLPNRRLLLDRVGQALARYRRSGEAFTLAFVDLNSLKQVNDRFGHPAGDELLKHVSRCLAANTRSCDTVARYGGDEFVLLLAGVDAATSTIERIVLTLDQPFTLAGRPFQPTCSLGVALCPRDGMDAASLLQVADDAMYRAKSTSRSGSAVHGL